ncbi:MAG: adenylate/guanylate cyclase domain-containing protein, partial [Proteobacteria bacterium]
ACWCAVRIRESLIGLNFKRHIDNQPIIAVGIGIHSGDLVSGVITTISKTEFTVFGGVVNTASRIEALTKHFSVDCLVSENTFLQCQQRLNFQKMPFHELRGITTSQSTYWLLPTNEFIGNKYPST